MYLTILLDKITNLFKSKLAALEQCRNVLSLRESNWFAGVWKGCFYWVQLSSFSSTPILVQGCQTALNLANSDNTCWTKFVWNDALIWESIKNREIRIHGNFTKQITHPSTPNINERDHLVGQITTWWWWWLPRKPGRPTAGMRTPSSQNFHCNTRSCSSILIRIMIFHFIQLGSVYKWDCTKESDKKMRLSWDMRCKVDAPLILGLWQKIGNRWSRVGLIWHLVDVKPWYMHVQCTLYSVCTSTKVPCFDRLQGGLIRLIFKCLIMCPTSIY